MTTYVDYADYYDFDHDTQIDVAFYLDYTQQCGSPILELACGTGRLTVPLAEAVYEIYGMDLSENMLAICRRKVEEKKLGDHVHLFHDDMARFDLPRKEFNLVFIPVRSFMHLYTQEDQLGCLQRAYNHLCPGRIFIVDIYAPRFDWLAQKLDGRYKKIGEFDLPSGNHIIRKNRFIKNDLVNQVQYGEILFEEYDAAGSLIRKRTVPMNTRYTFRYKLQLLLERVGFDIIDFFGDYEKLLYDGTGEIIAVARRL